MLGFDLLKGGGINLLNMTNMLLSFQNDTSHSFGIFVIVMRFFTITGKHVSYSKYYMYLWIV